MTNYLSAGPGLQLADDITLSGAEAAALAFYNIGVFGGGYFDVTVGLYTNCPGHGGTSIPGAERTFTGTPDYGSPVFLSATFDWLATALCEQSRNRKGAVPVRLQPPARLERNRSLTVAALFGDAAA